MQPADPPGKTLALPPAVTLLCLDKAAPSQRPQPLLTGKSLHEGRTDISAGCAQKKKEPSSCGNMFFKKVLRGLLFEVSIHADLNWNNLHFYVIGDSRHR